MKTQSQDIPTRQEGTYQATDRRKLVRRFKVLFGTLAFILAVGIFGIDLLQQGDPARLQASVTTGKQAVTADTTAPTMGPIDTAKVALKLPVQAPKVPVKARAARPQKHVAKVADGAHGLKVRELTGGVASYYGAELAGRRTASGERFSPDELTAAHRSLPFGSLLRVTNTRNGRSVVVRVNDRGPFAHRRVIDLSKAAAREIGMVRTGTAKVKIELLQK